MQGQGISVPLGSAHTLTIQAAQMSTLTAVTINRIVDLQGESIVRCFCKELNNPITLWGPDTTPTYAQIGDWTQQDAQDRLASIVNAM
jgi:hypothetical protein